MTDERNVEPDDDDADGSPELTVGQTVNDSKLVQLARQAGWPIVDQTEIVFDDDRGDDVIVVATDNGSARLAMLLTDDGFTVVRYINLACYVHEDLPDALRTANLPYVNFLRLTKEHKLEADA